MYSGVIVAAYSFLILIRYIRSPDGTIKPLWFGPPPVAFETAALFVILGLSVFWAGWGLGWIGDRLFRDDPGYKHRELTLVEQVQVVIAVLSSAVMLVSSIFALLRR